MTVQTNAITPQPYGATMRKVVRPVQATTQIYQGSMVAEIAGAIVPGTTASASDCVGIAEHDQLGGASNGTTRVSVLYDGIFVMKAGANAPTDATPWGTPLFMEDNQTVGTGGSAAGSTARLAGRFVGLEDDGRVRLYIGVVGTGSPLTDPTIGTALTDTAATTIQRVGRVSRYLLAGTMSQGETITLGTTGAVYGDVIRVIRTSTSAQTAAIVNGGAGAGTLCTLVASKVNFAQAWFDGTNWLFDGCGPT